MKQKPKHNWMHGFVIPPRTAEADIIRKESMAKIKDRQNKQLMRGRS